MRRFLAHELDRILIAEPIGAFHGVVHVPAPVVLAHVAERGTDAALRSHGMAARREDFRNTRRRKPGVREPERRAQSRSARADDDDVETVIYELRGAHATLPNTARSTAKSPRAASTICTN